MDEEAKGEELLEVYQGQQTLEMVEEETGQLATVVLAL
jgi:hypothetical protein